MAPQEPSGVLCSPCGEEIDLFDGPIRMIGRPKAFPFCWKCWRQLYRGLPQHLIIAEDGEDGRLYIYLQEEKLN